MLVVNYISYATRHIEGESLPLDSAPINKLTVLHERIMRFLAMDSDFSSLATPLLPDIFELRLSLYQALQSEKFKLYLEVLIDKMVNIYNFYPQSRLSTIVIDALDLAACMTSISAEKREIEGNTNKSYWENWLQSSLEMEVALILAEECLANHYSESTKEKVADYLKVVSEKFGAYAILIGVWSPVAGHRPYNYDNIRIVASALRLKHKYPHLAVL